MKKIITASMALLSVVVLAAVQGKQRLILRLRLQAL